MRRSTRCSRGRASVVVALVLAVLVSVGILCGLYLGLPGLRAHTEAPAGQPMPAPQVTAVVPSPSTEKSAEVAAAPAEAATPRIRIFGKVTDKGGTPLGGMCVRWVPMCKPELPELFSVGAFFGAGADASHFAEGPFRDAFQRSLTATTGDDGMYELNAPRGSELGFVAVSGAGYAGQLEGVTARGPKEAPAPAADASARDDAAAASAPDSTAQRESEINLQLARAGSISGTVRNRETGKPAAGVVVAAGLIDDADPGRLDIVRADVPTVVVGGDGTYVLDSLRFGEYCVLPRTGRSDYVALTAMEAQRVTLREGLDVTGIDFLVSVGGAIRGVVKGPDAKPLEDVRVRLAPADIMAASKSRDIVSMADFEREVRLTSATGIYEFRGLAFDREFRVLASTAGMMSASSDGVKLTAEHPRAEVDIAMSEGWTITGAVSYRDGTPAAETMVRIFTDSNDLVAIMEGSPQAITDDAGEFQLEHVPAGEVKLYAGPGSHHAIFAHEGLTAVTLDGTGNVRDVKIIIDKPTIAALAGVVKDTWGNPVEGAQVCVMSPDGMTMVVQQPTGTTATTNAEGRFSLAELRGDAFQLTARKEGYSCKGGAAVAAGAQDIVLTLAKNGQIDGRLVTAAGTPPAPGGRVLAHEIVEQGLAGAEESSAPMSARYVQRSGEAVADDGAFSIEAPVGKVEVCAAVPGFALAKSGPIDVVAGQSYGGIKIIVTAGAILHGKVTLDDGTPVEGAYVRVESKEGNGATLMRASPQLSDPDTPTSRSGGDGLFAIAHLAAGEYVVNATHPKYAPAEPVTVTLGRDEVCDTVKLVLRPGGSIAGKVIEHGKPKAGMLMQLVGHDESREPFLTDATGEFLFDGLLPGEYAVAAVDTAAVQSGGISLRTRIVSVESGKASEVTIAIGSGRKVFGKVKGHPATEAPKRILILRRPGGPNPEDIKADDEKAVLEISMHIVGMGFVSRDDTYEIPDIEPGTYILDVARTSEGPQDAEGDRKVVNRKPYFHKEITVKDADLEVNIEITP